mgnify:CR=1 FL=1
MEIVEFLMARRNWRNMCLRANIVPKEKIEMWKKTRLALVESNALGKSERLLREAIQLIAPEWWGDETKFTLNRNVQCEKHRDSGNRDHSYVLFLGDFTGGALLFEDGTRIEEKYKWHKIDGSIPHWNEPHEGTKYSIILYRSKPFVAKTHIINKRIKARKADAEQNNGDASPNWINMTDKIKDDFIEAVAKMHNIDTKEISSNTIDATT